MAFACPHCEHRVSIKNVKPGRYKPKCPKCGRVILLTIDGDNVTAKKPPPPKKSPSSKKTPPSEKTTVPKPGAATSPTPSGLQETLLPKATPLPDATTSPAETTSQQPNLDTTTLPETTSPKVTSPLSAAMDATTPPASALDATTAPMFDPETTAAPASTEAKEAEATANTPAGGVQRVQQKAKSAAGNFPQTLGGYRLIKELGRGAMGAVYLANQVSLDRNVALKTVQAKWAADPVFIARFTREAYAAAQLTHHNIVQIYDMGAEADVHFFSMEFVDGESLGELLERENKLPPEQAAGYILQAARGLKFAHDRGLIHRDIKPDNLMLNTEGVVKVADLGLVKSVGSNHESSSGAASAAVLAKTDAAQTMANMAMGTPMYMPPEQAENAAGVDHRADIYSLGCTLYVLLTGRPPFKGKSALEVMTKHKTEPMVRPELVVQGVPPEISKINMKMVAKKPSDRYGTLSEAIADLESYLGVGVAFQTSKEDAARWKKCVHIYKQATTSKIKPFLAMGVAAVCVLLAVGLLFFAGFIAAGGAVAMLASGGLGYFVVQGMHERSYLFSKARELVLASHWSDWLVRAVGLTAFGAGLWFFGGFFIWLAFCAAGFGLGAAFYYLVDRRIAKERIGAVLDAEELIRRFRLQGLEEESLRKFLVQFGGEHWEEFYEDLFGYEAKLEARRFDANRKSKRFRAWRDPIVKGLEQRTRAKRESREKSYLRKVEEAGLQAEGASPEEAKRKAQMAVQAIVDGASDLRKTGAPSGLSSDMEAVIQKRIMIKNMIAAAQRGEGDPDRNRPPEVGPVGRVFGIALGSKLRFLFGCLLVAGCVLWMRQNELLPGGGLQGMQDSLQTNTLRGIVAAAQPGEESEPLSLPWVPGFLTAMVYSYAAGAAGMVLVFTSVFRGVKMGVFMVTAVFLILFGPAVGVPAVGALASAETVSLIAGLAIATLGLVFGHSGDELG